jgi:hypothetical protein
MRAEEMTGGGATVADEVPTLGVLISSMVACVEETAEEEGGGAAEDDDEDET